MTYSCKFFKKKYLCILQLNNNGAQHGPFLGNHKSAQLWHNHIWKILIKGLPRQLYKFVPKISNLGNSIALRRIENQVLPPYPVYLMQNSNLRWVDKVVRIDSQVFIGLYSSLIWNMRSANPIWPICKVTYTLFFCHFMVYYDERYWVQKFWNFFFGLGKSCILLYIVLVITLLLL